MNEEEKQTIERIKRDYELAKSEDAIDIDIFTEDIKTVLNLLEKKDKIINLMAEKLNQAYFEGDKFERWFDKMMGVQEKMDYGYVVPLIKQYYERKVENGN